ncbi:hypothetical protein DHBDCA_p1327 [Dehalobacter sp. DCA]|nr:hypothetical protein DHBDCA_p1327 [Dehalobacter sp. DCA]
MARPSTSLPLFTRLDSSCIYAAGYNIFKEQQEINNSPHFFREKSEGLDQKTFIFLKVF